MTLRQRARTKRPDRALYESELALVDPEVRSSRQRVEALLHDDFSETGSSGQVYDRVAMVEMLISEAPGEVIIRDFESTHLSDDVAMVTYRSIGISGQEARRTSIWVRNGAEWQLRHHQGTRVPDRWSARAS
jgi:hypothetical protein